MCLFVYFVPQVVLLRPVVGQANCNTYLALLVGVVDDRQVAPAATGEAARATAVQSSGN